MMKSSTGISFVLRSICSKLPNREKYKRFRKARVCITVIEDPFHMLKNLKFVKFVEIAEIDEERDAQTTYLSIKEIKENKVPREESIISGDDKDLIML